MKILKTEINPSEIVKWSWTEGDGVDLVLAMETENGVTKHEFSAFTPEAKTELKKAYKLFIAEKGKQKQ